jgi:CubicO group peptidase (beta-lactamase class C family)
MAHLTEEDKASIAGLIPELDRLAVDVMADWQVPGAALAVVQDGTVALTKAYGQRDVEANLPVTRTTQFVIGSITKSFTATGVALLHNEGRLDWIKPVRDYIPEFRLNDPVASERITVQDLLCHQSGLPRHDWVHLPGDCSAAELLDVMCYLELSRDIRAAYQYNNLCYNVAGLLIERVSGQSYEAFMRAPDRPAWHAGQLHPRRSRSIGRCRSAIYDARRHEAAGSASPDPGHRCRGDQHLGRGHCELDAAAPRQGRVRR